MYSIFCFLTPSPHTFLLCRYVTADHAYESCDMCFEGRSAPATGSQECGLCTRNTQSNVPSTGGTACIDCPANTYREVIALANGISYDNDCPACPAGKISVAGGSCTDCPAGKAELSTDPSNAIATRVCQDCPEGYSSQPGTRAAGTLQNCTACPEGEWSLAGKQCATCSAGMFASELGCTVCPDYEGT